MGWKVLLNFEQKTIQSIWEEIYLAAAWAVSNPPVKVEQPNSSKFSKSRISTTKKFPQWVDLKSAKQKKNQIHTQIHLFSTIPVTSKKGEEKRETKKERVSSEQRY